MARRASSALADDFAEVLSFLQERGIVPVQPPEDQVRHVKSIHAATYGLILWRFRLQGLPTHGRVFIEEIASDALQILPQVMMGFSKTAKLLVRGIVENTLRHLYFFDHPVEFARMNRDAKWYVSVEQLFEYARNHHEFLKTERRFDALGQLADLYTQLSAGVHGRAVKDLEMRTALSKITYDPKVAATDAASLRRCAHAVNFLLAIFHHAQVRSFALADRSLVLRGMPNLARQVWTEHESEDML